MWMACRFNHTRRKVYELWCVPTTDGITICYQDQTPDELPTLVQTKNDMNTDVSHG